MLSNLENILENLFFLKTKIEVEIFESESIDEAREMPRSWKLMKPGKCREVGNWWSEGNAEKLEIHEYQRNNSKKISKKFEYKWTELRTIKNSGKCRKVGNSWISIKN